MKQKQKSKTRNSKAWYVRARGSYLPCSWQGALSYIPLILFAIIINFAAFRQGATVASAITTLFTGYVALGVAYHWFASQKV